MKLQRFFCFSFVLLQLTLSISPAAYAGSGYADFAAARTLKEMEATSNTRWIDVPGRGETLFYAQANPLWAKMRYEERGSSSYRNFGAGGCAPTSVAIAIANLLPQEALGQIRPYAATLAGGFGLSVGNMNPMNMRGNQGVLWLNTAEEYLQYLPLVFGQYAAGNNQKRTSWRAKPREEGVSAGGTNVSFVTELCDIYGLPYARLMGKGNTEWMDAVRCGAMAIALANSSHHPFSDGSGHYVTIVGCDDDYLYIMDPQDKGQGEYSTDKRKVLDVMEPGLVRVSHENFYDLHIAYVYIIANEEVNARLVQQNAQPVASAK